MAFQPPMSATLSRAPAYLYHSSYYELCRAKFFIESLPEEIERRDYGGF